MLRTALCAVVAGAVLFASAPDQVGATVNQGDRAKELVKVTSTKGRKLTLEAFKGDWVVMTIGASWCEPCEKELPALEKVARRVRTKHRNVQFLAINVDEEEADGREFMKSFDLECVIAGYNPTGGTKDIYDPPHMPSTYLISPKRVIMHLHDGYEVGDEKDIEKKIYELVGK